MRLIVAELPLLMQHSERGGERRSDSHREGHRSRRERSYNYMSLSPRRDGYEYSHRYDSRSPRRGRSRSPGHRRERYVHSGSRHYQEEHGRSDRGKVSSVISQHDAVFLNFSSKVSCLPLRLNNNASRTVVP